jgi:hypothetical protein
VRTGLRCCQMKRILLRILLTALVLVELWLLTGFLPQRWQENMYTRLNKIWPSQSYDYSRITHPNMEGELQRFEPIGTALLAVSTVLNGAAIVALWRRRDV